MLFEGVFVANVTPFQSKTDELDLLAYRRHLKWLSDQGVHGFVPCGTTGEGPCLSEIERKQLIEISCEEAKTKKLKVIAGCGSNSTASALKMIQEAKAIGADAALVVTPYYNKPTQEGLIAHYQFLADRSSLPIILYHVPGRTNVTFQITTLQTLFKHPNIVGIKEASGQHQFWMNMVKNLDWNSKSILAGDDDAFALLLQLGGKGIISATANVVPNSFVELFNYAKERKWQEAFSVQKRLMSLIHAMFLETNPSPAKQALSLLNRMENWVRLPLVPVNQETKVIIQKNMTELGLV